MVLHLHSVAYINKFPVFKEEDLRFSDIFFNPETVVPSKPATIPIRVLKTAMYGPRNISVINKHTQRR